MVSSAELRTRILALLKQLKQPKKALSPSLHGLSRPTIQKKLSGEIPITYEEAVAISQYLSYPELACDHAPPPEQTAVIAHAIYQTVKSLPDEVQVDIYRMVLRLSQTLPPR